MSLQVDQYPFIKETFLFKGERQLFYRDKNIYLEENLSICPCVKMSIVGAFIESSSHYYVMGFNFKISSGDDITETQLSILMVL